MRRSPLMRSFADLAAVVSARLRHVGIHEYLPSSVGDRRSDGYT
jgi:hypothetical protein